MRPSATPPVEAVGRARGSRLARLGVLAAVGALMVVAVRAAPAFQAPQLRCGWFENPTPANAWLTDRDGEWLIAVQGGHQAEGDWPKFRRSRWVRTNGSYGYGCACMRVLANAETRTVARIVSSSERSLQTCRNDHALTEPKPDRP